MIPSLPHPARRLRPVPRTLALLLMCLFAASAAFAQLPKIFVASTGSDAATGARNAPKRNFQAAHDAVSDGGEIVVLDTAGYGALSITKSLTLTVPPGVNAFITVSGANNAIEVSAGTTGNVTLRGLILEGSGNTTGGDGVYVDTVGTLRLDDCTIRGFSYGLYVAGTAGLHLAMDGDQIRDVSTGLYLTGTTGTTPDAMLTNCTLDHASNQAIVLAAVATSNLTERLTLTNCVLTHHATALFALGGGATAYVDNCTFSGNNTGLNTSVAGQLVSRGNNTFTNNANDGSFTGTVLPGQ